MLLNYHIGRFVLSSLCAGDLVWMGFSSGRVAGCSLALLKPSLMMDILMSETC